MLSSIKARIISFYMIVLFAALAVVGLLLYFSLGNIVYNSIDSSLLSRAKALATLVSEDNNETEFDFSDETMWEYSPKARSFFQIRRPDGTTIEKSASLGNSELPFLSGENQTNYKTIFLNGIPSRLVNFHILKEIEKDDKATGRYHSLIIQCAEDISDRIKVMKTYRIVLSFSIFAVMIISAFGGFLIARKALTPIKEISKTVGSISESNLSKRITVEEIPKELRILASSFNRTFDSLERSFNRQKQFAADASHELRTPLSVILSESEVTLRKDRSPREYKDALTAVMNAAKIMSDMVQKLLVLARLTTDKIGLNMEKIDINEIIHESVRMLTPLADQKGISMNISIPDRFVIRGDRAALLELFVNIIDNAIKYNVPLGKIDICVKKENVFIITKIKDTGIGIPGKDLDRVFDRFYRVDISRSREPGSVGLGLSICEGIAKLHGGRIEIKSKVGEGTTVSVYLK
ncbi:signal transduction histidine-protein kinase ArlS [bacterium BMS3Abin10]|nr:signal transduction histidine-protein kinase ArlS [bacterium BMS3Abin10]GBE38776.1 signal transduction histidine-protein kinase ArlS [bacterium BMS3Bbin08]HDH51392.1 HAMP domain-containing protein [Nitrospirota bacterium]